MVPSILYTGQPYSARKKPTHMQRGNSDTDEEESMSTSKADHKRAKEIKIQKLKNHV